ncbi:sulfatase modifying factor 1 [Klebsiella pneumoniae]|nr:sulfatase modifying factor 1 [Klebsiella pneumoniae]
MRDLILQLSKSSIYSTKPLGCDQKSTGKRETLSEALVAKSLSNMVPVKGGEFLMGDFGPLVGEKLPFSINQDDKVLHKVVFLCRLVWNEL